MSKKFPRIKVGMDLVGDSSKMHKNLELTFFYPSLSPKISTDILEIETYSNNLVVAPTIGNLVTYFSDERPVPYLAKSWRRDGVKWIFEIRDGLKCENGEPITAQGFAKSLAKSIRLYSQEFDHPIFKNLVGYKQLVKDKLPTFPGVSAVGNLLTFEFENPVRGGFLEHLTMSPFGYICEANYNGDIWKNSEAIVSSGPFKLEAFQGDDNFTLTRREEWPTEFKGESKKVVIKRAGLEAFKQHQGIKIVETQNPVSSDLEAFPHVRQIPQNLIVVKLNSRNGAFKDQNTRRIFLESFRRHFNKLDYQSSSIYKTERFFASDKSDLKDIEQIAKSAIAEKPKLTMKVMMMGPNSPNDLNKQVVLEVGKELGWEIAVNSEPYESFRQEFNDPKYDIFVQAAEVGGGFEGWVIDMLFCSDVGDQWPDPSGRICALTKEFNDTSLSEHVASQRFQDYLIEDAALIPTFHRGGFYLFSESLDVKSLGPMVTRIRFEEVKEVD